MSHSPHVAQFGVGSAATARRWSKPTKLRATTLSALALLFVVLTRTLLYAGEVIDRIVATVNGHIILQSDWDEAVAYEALLNHRPLSQVSVGERKAALDRLIDQELIREQSRASDFHHGIASEVEARIGQIRKDHPEAVDEASWRALLAQFTLSADELRDKVAAELDELKAVDAHLRPSIDIDPVSVEAYYRDKLLPELRQAGRDQVPLAQVAPRIKELLAQQKMNDLLISWLHTLRSESSIHMAFDSPPGGGGGD